MDLQSNTYLRIEAAQAVAERLRERGIPETCIRIEDHSPAEGLSLGAGIGSEAIEAVVNQHLEEPGAGYVVVVETGGDFLNERIAQEVFAGG